MFQGNFKKIYLLVYIHTMYFLQFSSYIILRIRIYQLLNFNIKCNVRKSFEIICEAGLFKPQNFGRYNLNIFVY